MSYLYTSLVGLFCTITSGVVTFLLTRKKYTAEVESQQIKNMNEAFAIYKKTMEDSLDSQKNLMEQTIAYQTDVIGRQNKKIDDLQKENEALRAQVNDLQLQIIKFLGNKFNKKNKK